MSKFKEGDPVRLCRHLEVGDFIEGYQFLSSMSFDGIRQVLYVDEYGIQIDGYSLYTYTDGMLESAEDPILIPSDCPEPTFFKKPHYSSLACRHKFSPIKFSKH